MKAKGTASLEFLLFFLLLVSVISLFLHSLSSIDSKAGLSLDFFKAKSNALECAFAVDSLGASDASGIKGMDFECFSDSNFSVSSSIGGKSYTVFVIPSSSLSVSDSGISIIVEGAKHYA